MKKALAITLCALSMLALFAGCTNKDGKDTTAPTSGTTGMTGMSTTSRGTSSDTTTNAIPTLEGAFGDVFGMVGRADDAVRDLLGGGKDYPETGEATGRLYAAELFGDKAEVETRYGTDKNVSSVDVRFTKSDLAAVKKGLTEAFGTEPTETANGTAKEYVWTVGTQRAVLTEKNGVAHVRIEGAAK